MKNTLNKLFVITMFSIFPVFVLDCRSVNAQTIDSNIDNAQKYYKEKQYQKSVDSYSQAQIDNPQNAALKYNIGNAYYKLNDFKNSIQNYLHSINDKNTSNSLAKTYYNLGNSYYKNGQRDKALDAYLKSIRLNPNDPQAKQNYEFVLNEKNSPKCKNPNNKQKQNQDKNKNNKDKKDNKSNNKDDKDKNNKSKNNDKKEENKKNKTQPQNQQMKNDKKNLNKTEAENILNNIEDKKPVQRNNRQFQYNPFNDKDW